jgi:hypothetical protein
LLTLILAPALGFVRPAHFVRRVCSPVPASKPRLVARVCGPWTWQHATSAQLFDFSGQNRVRARLGPCWSVAYGPRKTHAVQQVTYVFWCAVRVRVSSIRVHAGACVCAHTRTRVSKSFTTLSKDLKTKGKRTFKALRHNVFPLFYSADHSRTTGTKAGNK